MKILTKENENIGCHLDNIQRKIDLKPYKKIFWKTNAQTFRYNTAKIIAKTQDKIEAHKDTTNIFLKSKLRTSTAFCTTAKAFKGITKKVTLAIFFKEDSL